MTIEIIKSHLTRTVKLIHPSSKSMSPVNILYLNADQFTTMKRLELLEFLE